MSFEIRTYRGDDFEAVVELLERSLHADTITPELFTRKVLLDPNFDAGGSLVAIVGGRLVGFLLAINRWRPLEDGPDDSDRGYITLFAVEESMRRQGIGSALLEHGIEYFRAEACKRVLVSPYAPNYWTPGVDEAAYPAAIAFLGKRGFKTVSRPISMNASLAGWQIPVWVVQRIDSLEDEGIEFDTFKPQWIPLLTWFLRIQFAGDWQRYVRETMLDITAGRRASDELIIAHRNGEILGFAQHEGERFGPFGVAAYQRGKGIGAALLFLTLDGMRRKRHHNAWFMWTDDATAERIYKSAGFRETRRFAVMSRDL